MTEEKPITFSFETNVTDKELQSMDVIWQMIRCQFTIGTIIGGPFADKEAARRVVAWLSSKVESLPSSDEKD